MSAVLREQGFEVEHQGATWADAEALAVTVPDVIVVDLWMPTYDEEALALVRQHAPDAILAVVTALDADDATRQVADIGVDLVLSKSRPPDEVAALIAARARGAEPATA